MTMMMMMMMMIINPFNNVSEPDADTDIELDDQEEDTEEG
jgi:hypothetical protein